LHGRITSIAPVADATTHTTSVEAIVEHPGSAIPGAFVRIALHGRARIPSDGLRVPSSAVISEGERDAAVWRIADGSAHRIPVKRLSVDGATAVVRADALHAGDHVVLDAGAALEEGEHVTERGEAPR
jgi:multidrug efflux pump subunit AcrA (membrane-fusion protein)